jgi:Ca-activated chloride channel homolog
MIALGHVALLRPWWLLVLPVVVVLFLLSRPRGGMLAGWEKAAEPHLLAAMVARGGAAGGGFRAPLVLATLVLGILALAGPAVQRATHDRLRNLDATVIVFDVSQDMASGGAIREAAAAAHDLLQHLGARQAGLIVYAGDAYVASALTDYVGGIDTDLFSLDDTTVPDPGARPDRALAQARKMLEEAHIIAGDVILISAGGGLEGAAADRAAQALAAAGHRVYAMAVKAGPRHAAALQRVAAAGDGFAVDVGDPGRLYDVLENEAIARTGNSVVNALDWRDLGRYLLILAALPLLLGFRKTVSA